MLLVELPQGKEGLHSLLTRLPNADEDAAGVWYLGLSSCLNRRQPSCGFLHWVDAVKECATLSLGCLSL